MKEGNQIRKYANEALQQIRIVPGASKNPKLTRFGCQRLVFHLCHNSRASPPGGARRASPRRSRFWSAAERRSKKWSAAHVIFVPSLPAHAPPPRTWRVPSRSPRGAAAPPARPHWPGLGLGGRAALRTTSPWFA